MPRKLYLHVGMHKTATTSLQSFLSSQKKWLLQQNILYPSIRNANNHRQWGMCLVYGSQNEARASVKLWNTLIKPQLDAHLDCDVLLSYEGLWSMARQEVQHQPWRCELLQECLQGFEVHLIAYLRRQDDWCEAMYNQQVKTWVHAGDLQTFVEDNIKSCLLDYPWVAEFWQTQMGVHQLHVSVFEPEQLQGGNIFSDFLHHLGLPPIDSPIPPNREKNKRLSPPAVAIKRKLNPHLKPDWRNHLARHALQMLQPFLPKTNAHLLPYAEALHIEELFADSNAQFARQFLGRSDGILFRHPVTTQTPWEHYPLD